MFLRLKNSRRTLADPHFGHRMLFRVSLLLAIFKGLFNNCLWRNAGANKVDHMGQT